MRLEFPYVSRETSNQEDRLICIEDTMDQLRPDYIKLILKAQGGELKGRITYFNLAISIPFLLGVASFLAYQLYEENEDGAYLLTIGFAPLFFAIQFGVKYVRLSYLKRTLRWALLL